ncbi:hypothetical protein BJX61DRAFT_516646 [Aspergillus egyptiacus]|nr:hypothetical protein BJX61DRAFT_516646 [Aspergillus egyptiacus]
MLTQSIYRVDWPVVDGQGMIVNKAQYSRVPGNPDTTPLPDMEIDNDTAQDTRLDAESNACTDPQTLLCRYLVYCLIIMLYSLAGLI